MDMFEELFGDSDSESEFVGFNVEDIEGMVVDEDDEEEIDVENLDWTRNASNIEVPVFSPSFGPQNFPSLPTALGFFFLFFRLEVFQHIVDETNRYARQENMEKDNKDSDWYDEDGNAIEITVEELKAFLGVQIMMGIIKLPTLRSYFNEQEPFLYQPEIAKVFPRNRFLAIMRYIHLNDNENLPPRDDPSFKLYRVQPLVDFMKMFCLDTFEQYFPADQELSIDEAMIKYKGRLSFVQYMPNKPVKRGIKVFCLCDARTGFVLKFDVYVGRQANAQPQKNLAEAIVLKLVEGFEGKNFYIFMDNWFTSIKLFMELLARDIRACGTLRADRKGFPLCLKDVKLSQQGDSAFAQCGDLVISVWRDKAKNKPVRVLSTMFPAIGDDTVTRRKKTADGNMENIVINRPPAITQYSKFMGGVDLSDQNRSYYPVQSRRNVKWWKYIFYFLLDISIVNAWVLMKKVSTGCTISHLEFRLALAKGLIGTFSARKKLGRPTTGPVLANVEHQQVELLPTSKGKQCKNCQLKRKREKAANREGKRPRESRFGCGLCNVVLCNSPCFKEWHS